MYHHCSLSGSSPRLKPGLCGFLPKCPPGTLLLDEMADPAIGQLTAEAASADTRGRWRGLRIPTWQDRARRANVQLARKRLEATTRRVRATESAELHVATCGSDRSHGGPDSAASRKQTLDPVTAGYVALFRTITGPRQPGQASYRLSRQPLTPVVWHSHE
jgi:hypothetical protein